MELWNFLLIQSGFTALGNECSKKGGRKPEKFKGATTRAIVITNEALIAIL